MIKLLSKILKHAGAILEDRTRSTIKNAIVDLAPSIVDSICDKLKDKPTSTVRNVSHPIVEKAGLDQPQKKGILKLSDKKEVVIPEKPEDTNIV